MQCALDTQNLSPPFPITRKWEVLRVLFWLPLLENRDCSIYCSEYSGGYGVGVRGWGLGGGGYGVGVRGWGLGGVGVRGWGLGGGG